jgi:hypothetical protein
MKQVLRVFFWNSGKSKCLRVDDEYASWQNFHKTTHLGKQQEYQDLQISTPNRAAHIDGTSAMQTLEQPQLNGALSAVCEFDGFVLLRLA